MTAPLLLAVPNVSEGRDLVSVDAIAAAFAAGGAARLLDVHHDPDHHRAVVTLAGRPGSLADALVAGAAEAVRRIDIGSGDGGGAAADARGRGEAGAKARRDRSEIGQHPYVGAVDVVPLVYLDPALRGAACAEALVAADRIGGELGVPVFVYGELAGADRATGRRSATTRAELRRGGVQGLAERMRSGELTPDFGPHTMHPTAGAALVGARGPLVAFNLELAPPATVADARRIAGLIREGGAEGLPGVRALGLTVRRGPQVSLNVERPAEVPLRTVVAAVRAHAEVACAELVGLAPVAAMEGFPEDLPMPAFDPARHVIENALGL
jgi:glutamate formiminotransferase / 5-formyltetrahydrofolate cyclo-ligase